MLGRGIDPLAEQHLIGEASLDRDESMRVAEIARQGLQGPFKVADVIDVPIRIDIEGPRVKGR